VVFCFRSATPDWKYIERFRFALEPIANTSDPAGALSLELALQDVFTADYTGGTDLSTVGDSNYAITPRIRDAQRVTQALQTPVSIIGAGDVRIASTVALGGGGGGSGRTQPWSHSGRFLGNATAQDPLVLEWSKPESSLHAQHPQQGCMVLAPDTGFIVRIPVNAAGGLTLRFSADIDWLEL
jgi:hypothetical protein